MHLTTDNLNYPAGHTPMTQQFGGFDPFAEMLKRKQMADGENVDFTVTPHNEEDVKELEDFCMEHGIVGFNCGRMSPKSALRMLKSKMGVIEKKPTQLLQG